ncbi:hypothetical protein COHA_001749 [Chlorella ohadii]|uniref:Uncharacterized protein n=1 Tax=Chlorella ohadii TaxID=2649997 RepID=A0AAD5DVA4_9CHLO|nr:hypothetical protein COHA_001749 [Chlorella ohadii]
MWNGGDPPAEAVAPRPIADEELHLLARYTGQSDLAALREHVLALWRRACSGSAPVYLCVRALMFLEPRVRSHLAYQRALQLMADARQAAAAATAGGAAAPAKGGLGEAAAEAATAASGASPAPPPLWIDVGAAVGTDVRQLRVDGLAFEELVALDVPDARHYWDVGLELYQDASKPPCVALFGDITDDAVLPPPAASASGTDAAVAAASAPQEDQQQQGQPGQQQEQRWGSIAELAGSAQVVSCTAVLHCLGQEQVAALLSKMTLLLRPGGLLLGSTLGAPTARPWEASYQAGHTRWLHSADSLAAALEAAGFVQVEVAPTSWRDLAQHRGAIQPLVQQHVGSGLGEDDRCMLAFTAVRPAA